jgi:hypothetical protein
VIIFFFPLWKRKILKVFIYWFLPPPFPAFPRGGRRPSIEASYITINFSAYRTSFPPLGEIRKGVKAGN